MLEKKNENKEIGLKSQLILPIFFILTLTITLFILLKDDFASGLSPFVVWLYFGVLLVYSGLSIFDVFKNKEKSKSISKFVIIFAILTIVMSIFFIVIYLVK